MRRRGEPLSATPFNASAALAEEAALAAHAMNPFDMPDDPNEPAPLPEAERFLEVYKAAKNAEAISQCQLLHDVFGDAFRPVPLDPSWLTFTAVSLAQQMYDSRDFGAMPILADALQDAGCDNEDILAPCRGEGSNVRVCWVVDLMLDKG